MITNPLDWWLVLRGVVRDAPKVENPGRLPDETGSPDEEADRAELARRLRDLAQYAEDGRALPTSDEIESWGLPDDG